MNFLKFSINVSFFNIHKSKMSSRRSKNKRSSFLSNLDSDEDSGDFELSDEVYDQDNEDEEYTPKMKPRTRRSTRVRKTRNFSPSTSTEDTDESLDSSDFATTEDDEENLPYEEEEEVLDERPQYIIGKKDIPDTEDAQYYVKFAGLSYIHCKYMTGLELQVSQDGKKAKGRFEQRLEHYDLVKSDCVPGLLAFEDKDPQQEFFKVERILDEKETKSGKIQVFVKWQNLGYDECTWEKKEDIECDKELEEYRKRLDRTNKKNIPSRWSRPPASHYKPLDDYPKSKEGFNLREYQKIGVDWLRFCYYNKRNSILADEMGLGKTCQIVTALSTISKQEGINGPFLVVAPLSTLPQWKAEFERWSDLNAIIFHGSPNALDTIRGTEFYVVNKAGKRVEGSVGFDVLITNYDTLLVAKDLAEIDWQYLVVDEGHRLKNKNSTLYGRLQQMSWQHCTLLTGTPIQNNLSELFNLLSFLDQKTFDDEGEFMEKYGTLKESGQVDDLKTLIKPYILRRVKSEVESSLQAKEETIIEVELTRQQKKYYKALISDNKEVLLKKLTKGAIPSLTSLATELRKVCNHPYLIKGAEDKIIEEKAQEMESGTPEGEIEIQAMIDSSGKLILVDKLLPKLKKDGHKVLIFSQWTRILDILEDFLRYKKYNVLRLDGSVKGVDREISINKFNTDPDSFVFLISTKAGGVGINLTTADTVILFDSDWNPQNDLQAEARCHRIGQTKKVKVYRLVTRGTYESKMIETASRKLGLDHVVLDGRNANLEKLNAKEIEEMLRTGVSAIFNEDDTECDEFCSADIDQILERRAKRFSSDVVSGGDSIFAKASFNATQDDLKMNAADFWKQVLPENETVNTDDDMDGLIRRCRKDILSPRKQGCDDELNIAIDEIIDSGFKGSKVQEEVLRRAASSFKFEEDQTEAKEIIERFVGEIPEESVFGSTPVDARITRKSPMIIEYALFFYHLEHALFAAQGDIEWPILLHSWEGIEEEYALMLALYRAGFNQLQNESSKNIYNLRNVEIPPKSEIKLLISSLCSALGSAASCKIDDPDEWFKKHITKEAIQKRSRIAVFKGLSLFGISLNKDGEEDWQTFMKKSGIHFPENIKEVGTEVLKMIEENDPLLTELVGSNSVSEAKKNIKGLRKIHEIASKINTKKGYFNGSPTGLPEWWTPSHSKYFIQNMSQYGMSRISTWISSKISPFLSAIPSSAIKSFHNAAKREEESRTPEKPSKAGALSFLFDNNRVSLGLRICNTFVEAETSEIKYESVPETPFKVDQITVTSFGSIYKGDKYRGRLTPYPIGYTSERKYRIAGSKRPAQLIRSEIVDGPVFVITLLGQKEKVLARGISPTDAWQKAIDKLAKSERLDPSKTKFSGSSLYGLTHPQVFKIIKNMDVEAAQMEMTSAVSDPKIEP